MRIGKALAALELATGAPRDWNVLPALWGCGQMKACLVISPSCALRTLHRSHVQDNGASVGACAA